MLRQQTSSSTLATARRTKVAECAARHACQEVAVLLETYTFSNIERTNNDIKGTQQNIEQWPKLIKQLEDQIATGDKVLSDLDACWPPTESPPRPGQHPMRRRLAYLLP
jgi:hypothetical protein